MAKLHETPDGKRVVTGGFSTRKKEDMKLLEDLARKDFGKSPKENG